MTLPLTIFSGLIFISIGLVFAAPLVLLGLLIRDWIAEELW